MSAAIRKSEAQSNAEALARRTSTYAGDHARTWELRFHRREPASLRDVVRDLRAAYAGEVPGAIHNGDVAEDGAPQMRGEFLHFIDGSPRTLDEDARYRTPFRAAMSRSSGTVLAIVRGVVVTGDGPAEAAVAAGVPEDVAKITADAVLRRFWRGMSSGPLPTPSASA